MTVAAIHPKSGMRDSGAYGPRKTEDAATTTESRAEETRPDHYTPPNPISPRSEPNFDSAKTREPQATAPIQGSGNYENPDELVGPQALPEDRLLMQRLRQECALGEARVLNRLNYAGTVLLVGGLSAGLVAGGMFGKKALLGQGQRLVHSLALFTEPGEGRSWNLDALQEKASAIPGGAGDQAVRVIEEKMQKHQGKIDAAIGEIHQELTTLDARLQSKMQIDEKLGFGLAILGGASFLTGSILLLRRRGQQHYFNQAGRCTPDGLMLRRHDRERNRIETNHLDRSVGPARAGRRRSRPSASFSPQVSRTGFSLHFTLKF